MSIDDIDGCKTYLPGYKYTEKPSFNLMNLDIEGTISTPHYYKNQRQD